MKKFYYYERKYAGDGQDGLRPEYRGFVVVNEEKETSPEGVRGEALEVIYEVNNDWDDRNFFLDETAYETNLPAGAYDEKGEIVFEGDSYDLSDRWREDDWN